jgi:integrase
MNVSVCLHNEYVKIQVTNANVRKRISTGIKIEVKDSLTKSGKLKSIVPDYQFKNNKIQTIKETIETIVKDYFSINKRDIQVDELIEIYKNPQILYPSEEKKSKKILDYYEKYYLLQSEKFNSDANFSDDSIKEYRGLKYYLKDYELFLEKPILYTDISYDWLIKFKTFNLTKREKTEKKQYETLGGIRSNTLKKKINLFISFLRWLEDETKRDFIFTSTLVQFSKNEIKSPKIIKDSLTIEEVKLLLETICDGNKEEFIRDIFVFSCSTGLRWSDIISIKKEDVKTDKNGDFFLKKYAQKTDEEFYVFLNKTAQQILEKYNYELALFSNSNFNKYLKLFLKKFDIFNEETNFKKIDSKTKKSINLLRYEVISIHRGRDTFINILLNSNVPINTIMRYTGHRSISSLQKYIDLNKPVTNYLNDIFN